MERYPGGRKATKDGAARDQRVRRKLEDPGYAKKNPCIGREAPISIDAFTARKLVFTIKLSEAYRVCSDSKVVLKLADDGTITGKHGRSKLALVRQ